MQLPDSVKVTRDAYVARFPVPQGPMGEAFEEEARQWTIKLAQQVAFSHPGEGWGVKSADAGRPISKDTIARRLAGRLLIWDLLTGTGTGRPTLVANPSSEDVTGQFFHEEIGPRDYLGTPVPPPVPVPVPVPPPVPAPVPAPADLSPVLARLAAVETLLQTILIKMGAQADRREALAKHADEVAKAQTAELLAAISAIRVRLF